MRGRVQVGRGRERRGLSFGGGDAGQRRGARGSVLLGGKPQDWNELIVSVHEGRMVAHLNGDRNRGSEGRGDGRSRGDRSRGRGAARVAAEEH